MGNVDIYSVGAESVYQIVQTGRTECIAGVSREGLTREILATHNCFHLVLTSHIPVMCKAHALLRRMLGCEILAKTSSVFNSLSLHTHSLSIIQPLQSNPKLNIGYKRLNKTTIKFGIE